ncbi:MAG: c-type cytochrome biogenesis protein CcmI [Pseudomonadota bacterium]
MFYVLITLIALLAVAIMLSPLWHEITGGDESEYLAVYKAQLGEIAKDVEKGVLSKADAEAAKLEVSRRLLAADKRRQNQTVAGSRRMRGLALAVGAISVLGVLGGYFLFGRPDLPDQPLAGRLEAAQDIRLARPAQAEIEAQVVRPELEVEESYLALLNQLRAAVAENPDDPQGLRLLAFHEANTGNYGIAHQTQAQLLAVLGDAVLAADYERWAEYQILAANGYVSPEAEQGLTQALRLDPSLKRSRYFSGLMMAQNGRPDIAVRLWRPLVEEGPEDAPWVSAIRTDYDRVAALAGLPGLQNRGPSAEDMEAANALSAEDRQEMIAGMVQGLSDRLASEGGPVQDWARLIRSLGVLGRLSDANAIYAEARVVFQDDAEALQILRAAAQEAEIVQ